MRGWSRYGRASVIDVVGDGVAPEAPGKGGSLRGVLPCVPVELERWLETATGGM